MPALAVADALRAAGAEVSWVGTTDRAEAKLIPAAGIEFDALKLSGIDRSNPLRAGRAVAQAIAAAPRARRLLAEYRADAVLGGGGYVAGPVGLAAITRGLPLVLTEADRHLGLANRMLARRAHRVCLAFEIPGLEPPRYVVTGRPVPASVGGADREAARTGFGVAAGDRCVLVFGGSQGARSLNETAVPGIAAAPERDFHVIHISGERDHADVQHRLGEAGPSAAERYTLVAYEPDLAKALAACDLVLARSGASVFELAAAGRPAILVPYPHATGRHQHANAEWMAAAGAAVVIEDDELDPARALAAIATILGDPVRLERMSVASAGLARPQAAADVAAEVLAAVAAG